jgi:hypothetical protein
MVIGKLSHFIPRDSDMSYLNNLLCTVFSGDVGLDEEGINSALSSIRANPDKRELDGIRNELENLFNDPDADWVALLDREDCEVLYAESQDDARQYVVLRVWNALFPDEPR